MGVLIRGMEIPKNCRECNFCNEINFEGYLWFDFYCRAKDKSFDLDKNEDKPNWCPLIEVPPHGDLVDRNNLLEKACYDYNEATHDYNRFRVVFEDDIVDAPVVIKGNL